MTIADLLVELREIATTRRGAEVWVRVNINGDGMLDVANRVYFDVDGDLIIEGETHG